jgi:signal transduction histidine kinase
VFQLPHFEKLIKVGATMAKPETETDLTASQQDSSGNREINSDDVRALIAGYEAKLDDVAELIARVRHEINNPLAGVLGQAQLLLREDLSDKARKRAQTIEELAVRLRDIVAELRQVQKTPSQGGESS